MCRDITNGCRQAQINVRVLTTTNETRKMIPPAPAPEDAKESPSSSTSSNVAILNICFQTLSQSVGHARVMPCPFTTSSGDEMNSEFLFLNSITVSTVIPFYCKLRRQREDGGNQGEGGTLREGTRDGSKEAALRAAIREQEETSR